MRFLLPEEGGRLSPAMQGYRPDVMFQNDDALYMIHPEFIDAEGVPIPKDTPITGRVRALMRPYSEEVRRKSSAKVRVGDTIKIQEGPHTVALATVTEVYGDT